MDRFEPHPWSREKDRAFDRALMHQMRLVCEDARRAAGVRSEETDPQGKPGWWRALSVRMYRMARRLHA